MTRLTMRLVTRFLTLLAIGGGAGTSDASGTAIQEIVPEEVDGVIARVDDIRARLLATDRDQLPSEQSVQWYNWSDWNNWNNWPNWSNFWRNY